MIFHQMQRYGTGGGSSAFAVVFTPYDDALQDALFFSNGSGKSFVYELLKLADLFVPTWVPTMSTTADPWSDWYGLPVCAGDRHRITGVADVMLQTLQGETLLVAEVKSDAGGSGEFQLLAELRTLHSTPAAQPAALCAGTPREPRVDEALHSRTSSPPPTEQQI